MNINSFFTALALTCSLGVLFSQEQIIQAEDAKLNTGAIDNEHSGFTGKGFVNIDNRLGSSITWEIRVSKAGTYTLGILFANGSAAGRTMAMEINGDPEKNSFRFAPTGTWTMWKTEYIQVELEKGINTLALISKTRNGGPNMDALKIIEGDYKPPPPAPPKVPESWKKGYNNICLW